MDESFFRIATALAFLSAFGMSAYFRTRAQLKGGELRSSAGQRPLLVLRLVGLLILLPVLGYLINPDWVAWARFNPPTWTRLLAVGIGVINTVLVFWMYRSLDTNVSPVEEARQNASLITHGPYRWIRHPLYTFGFISIVALTFMTALWWVGVLALPLIVFFILWRVPREEARLVEVFGDAYRVYMRRTGRFFPKLTLTA
jgi:protein-S-isoprenylcysteine O-methyltransferase Ste14